MGTPVGTKGSQYRGLQIVNVVASGVLGSGEIDTDVLGAELSVEKTVLPGRVYLQPGGETPVTMVFRSGKFTVAGASSWEGALAGAQWLTETLTDVGVPIDREEMFNSLRVNYMVVTGDLGAEVNLATAVIALGMENSEYEPEQFPALIYRPEQFGCTVLIFSTGNINITGVEDIEKAYEVFKSVKQSLSELLT